MDEQISGGLLMYPLYLRFSNFGGLFFVKRKVVFEICIVGILAALSVILESVSIKISLFGGVNTYRITFYGIPLMISGIVFGLKVGFFTSFVTAFITQIIISEYGITLTTPLWMLSTMCWGIMPAFVTYIFKNNKKFYIIAFAVIFGALCASLMNSIALIVDGKVYNYPVNLTFINILIRLLLSVITTFIYIPLLYILSNKIEKLQI